MTKAEHDRGLVVAKIAARLLDGRLKGPLAASQIKQAVKKARMIVAEALHQEAETSYVEVVAEMEAAKV